MKDFKTSIIPNRIRQARVSRGFSMSELASLIGTTKQAVSQYEIGTSTPSSLVLKKMADILHYNINFFYKDMPINNSSNSAIFFRKKKTTRSKTILAACEKIKLFREINLYLCDYVDFPKPNLPRVDYDNDSLNPISNELIEEYALQLREAWGLGLHPIPNLMNIIQRNGISVSKMEFGDKKLDAFSVWYDGKPYIFLSSDKYSNARIRFDIAHELGHLIMHADYYTDEDLDDINICKKIEKEADSFAGAFLMPRQTFSRDIFSTSIDHFINLKMKWLTSISSMIYRCDDLNILSDNQIKYLKNQMTKRQYWHSEPLDREIPIEKPFAVKQAVNLLIDNNIISPCQFVNEIGCFADELEKYCFLNKGCLTSDDVSNTVKLKKSNIINFNNYHT